MSRAKKDYVSKKKTETEAARKLGSHGGRGRRRFTWKKTPIDAAKPKRRVASRRRPKRSRRKR